MARIFISHSSRDNEIATTIKNWLEEQGFEYLFLDFDHQKGIAPGEDWEKKLYDEIKSSRVVLLLLTRNWEDSCWCFAEYTHAKALGKNLLPLICEKGFKPSKIDTRLQLLSYADNRDVGLQRLLNALKKIAIDTECGGFPLPKGQPPYPGLMNFTEDDAAVFCGRSKEIAELKDLLNIHRNLGGIKHLMMIASSGAGKSSLVHAGLFPRLKLMSEEWIVLDSFRPGKDPLRQFAHVVSKKLTGTGRGHSLYDRIDTVDASEYESILNEIVLNLREKSGSSNATVLVTIDQGEELFTSSDDNEKDRLFHLLNIIEKSDLPFLVLIAMRSDHFEHLQKARQLHVNYDTYSLEILPEERIRDVIQKPADVAGVEIEQGVVDAIKADAKSADALPLLAYTLRVLYDSYANNKDSTDPRAKDNRIELDEYKDLGSTDFNPLENSVSKMAEKCIGDRPDPAAKEALRKAFVNHLCSISEDGKYIRKTANWEELPEKSRPLLRLMEKARLLRSVHDEEHGIDTLEVTHEALFRVWGQLTQWLDEAKEFLIWKKHFKRDFDEWVKNPGLPYFGSYRNLLSLGDLSLAVEKLKSHPEGLKKKERQFIKVSQRARQGRVGIAIASAIVLFGVTLISINQKKLADSKTIEAQQQLANNYWLQGITQRDKENNQARASHFFALAADQAEVLADRSMVDNARFAARYVAKGVRLTEMSTPQKEFEEAAIDGAGNLVVVINRDRKIWTWERGNNTWSEIPSAGGNVNKTIKQLSKSWFLVTIEGEGGKLIPVDMKHSSINLNGVGGEIRHTVFNKKEDRLIAWNKKHASFWKIPANSVEKLSLKPDKEVSFDSNIQGGEFIDNATALIWTAEGNIRLWNTDTGKTGDVVKIGDDVQFIVASSKIFLSVHKNKLILWDSRSLSRISEAPVQLQSSIKDARIHPDGTQVIYWNTNNIVFSWNVGENEQPIIDSENTNIGSVQYSKSGKYLLVTYVDGQATVGVNTEELVLINKHHLQPSGKISGARFSEDGDFIVMWGAKGATIWNSESGEPIGLTLEPEVQVRGARLTKNKGEVITWSSDGIARVWDYRGGEPKYSYVSKYSIDDLSYSAEGDSIFVLDKFGCLNEWNLSSEATPYRTLSMGQLQGSSFSLDKKHLLTWGETPFIKLYSLNSKDKDPVTLETDGAVGGAIFATAGKQILSWTEKNRFQLSDLASDNDPATFRLDNPLKSVYSNADGSWVLLSDEEDYLQIYDASSGVLQKDKWKQNIQAGVFSKDGSGLVLCAMDGVWFLDPRQSSNRIPVTVPGNCEGGEYSHDDKKVLLQGSHRIWVLDKDHESTTPFKIRHSLEHVDLIGAKWSSDDRWLLSWSKDGARIWDTSTGLPLTPLVKLKEDVSGASFSSDSSSVAVWGSYSVKGWELNLAIDESSGNEAEFIEARLGSRLKLEASNKLVALDNEKWNKNKNTLGILAGIDRKSGQAEDFGEFDRFVPAAFEPMRRTCEP